MARLGLCITFVLVLCAAARAEIYTLNDPLHHALCPSQDHAMLVVAGEIGSFDDEGAIEFRVATVILGEKSYQGQTLKVPVRRFIWPRQLVPLENDAFCILVLRPDDRLALYTVVPGRKRDYPRARDKMAARTVLADELLAQLKTEKAEVRQRAMLMQVAPILAKDKTGVVEGFLKSSDPWVRRSALAAMIYATEDPKYLEAAAKEIQDYFAQTKDSEWVDGLEPGVRMHPKTLLIEHYWFLERLTWTPGTGWDEEERSKHRRILDGMLKTKIMEEWVRKLLVDG